jgi:hypothetical protein
MSSSLPVVDGLPPSPLSILVKLMDLLISTGLRQCNRRTTSTILRPTFLSLSLSLSPSLYLDAYRSAELLKLEANATPYPTDYRQPSDGQTVETGEHSVSVTSSYRAAVGDSCRTTVRSV